MENAISKNNYSQEELLVMLKVEESLVEAGGYRPSRRRPHLEVFRDSITCLNFGSETLEPCERCWLMAFVPLDHHENALPCHQIPLNQKGETVASLEAAGDPGRLEQEVLAWLHGNIAKLEQDRKQSGATNAIEETAVPQL